MTYFFLKSVSLSIVKTIVLCVLEIKKKKQNEIILIIDLTFDFKKKNFFMYLVVVLIKKLILWEITFLNFDNHLNLCCFCY